jgi:hypothetical protein
MSFCSYLVEHASIISIKSRGTGASSALYSQIVAAGRSYKSGQVRRLVGREIRVAVPEVARIAQDMILQLITDALVFESGYALAFPAAMFDRCTQQATTPV